MQRPVFYNIAEGGGPSMTPARIQGPIQEQPRYGRGGALGIAITAPHRTEPGRVSETGVQGLGSSLLLGTTS